ncbi:MAG TPA: PKD domain-containing protein [Pelobium sp.]
MFKHYLKVFLSITFLSFSLFASGQGTSNKGKDFWVAYAGVSDNLSSRLTLFITSNSNATVNVTAGGQTLPVVNISAGQAVPVVIDANTYTNTYIAGSDQSPQINAGIHITSDVDIIVYCHISNSARSASSLILPVRSLGNEYYAISYTQSSAGNRLSVSEFTLVGVEQNTIVKITPTANSIGNTRLASDGTFEITLNKGDVYQYQSNSDLTGSKITTAGGCKPLAVFSGSTFDAYCEPGNTRNAGSGDPLYQQLFPTSSWGQNFITAPFYNAQNGSSDIIRVQVAKDNTTVSINGSTTDALGNPLNNPYAAGSVITFAANAATVISADAPVSVAQLQVTQSCNPNSSQFPGDPELTILNPIEQTLKDITVYSAVSTPEAPTAITKHYLNIILKTSDIPTLTVDGVAPQNNYQQINNTYSFITIDVTASSAINPAHRIRCDNGFVAIAYGYGNVESYAYLAGADLKNLNSGIEFFPVGGTIQASSLCLGEDYNAKLKLPYETKQIVWDFNNGTRRDSVATPAFTKDTLNGKISYYYNYKILSTDVPNAGSYSFKAIVLNPNPTGCDADEEVDGSFEVVALPTARFEVDKKQICGSDLVTFTDRSEGNGKSIVKWFWDFGDGTKYERTDGLPFTHRFLSPGDYNVKLYVQGETDCVSSTATAITVHVSKSPEAKFSSEVVNCVDKAIRFTDLSVPIEGKISFRMWDFGDSISTNNASTDSIPSHTYTAVGTYNVKLIVSTDLGCSDTIVKQVIVHPLPIVDFDMPDICLSDASATFTNNSTIADGSGMTFQWNFGDDNATPSNPNIATNPNHKYSRAAIYQVTLTATSANGCISSLTKAFTVNDSTPKAEFAVRNKDNLCSDQPVVFEDLATIDFGEVTKIEWTFDTTNPSVVEIDNAPASKTERQLGPKTYIHQYPKFSTPLTKEVTVQMKVYSGVTCEDVVQQKISLKASPSVIFNPLAAVCAEIAPFPLTQASETTGFIGTGKYTGDGVDENGLFWPAKAGVGEHTITYAFFGTNGCSDNKTQNITVYPTPAASAGADKVILTGGTVMLDATASGSNLTYKWTPSIGLDRDDILKPSASPSKDINYTLTVKSDQGCEAKSTVFVKVLQFPEIPNTFTPNGDGVNDTWVIKYLDSYPNATIKIFNRYGNEVFSANKYVAWDGKLNGAYVPQGMYYYIITAKNGELKYNGSLLIVR